MLPDKWLETKEKIKSGFKIDNEYTEKNEDYHEDKEVIEFSGPIGKMKVEWITRPKIIDKKTSYSRRIGGNVSVDYVYSPDEMTYNLKVYKWDEATGDWQEIKKEFNL